MSVSPYRDTITDMVTEVIAVVIAAISAGVAVWAKADSGNANRIAREAVEKAERANEISRESNAISREGSDIAAAANALAEELEHEAMARAVGVTVLWGSGPDGSMIARTEILNAGKYSISDAVLHLATDDEDFPMEVVYGTILPGRHLDREDQVPRSEVPFAELTSGVELLFTDSYGNHWARSPHALERRDNPARIC